MLIIHILYIVNVTSVKLARHTAFVYFLYLRQHVFSMPNE